MRILVTERMEVTKGVRLLSVLGGIVLAFAIISGVLGAKGFPVLEVWARLVTGAFGSGYSLRSTLIRAVPLAITATGILFAFRMKFWNIGGEGQILMGAFAATGFALFCPNLPKPVLLTVMLLAGFAAGGAWSFLAGWLKHRRGLNETIVTLMLNYVALQWVTFLQYRLWRDKTGLNFPKIPIFGDSAILPDFLGIHLGFWIMIAIVLLTTVVFFSTKTGFKMRIIGESPETARYLKIRTGPILLGMVFLSGGICGIAGMIQASAVNNTLNVSIAGGAGFTAIIIAWLSALNPPLCLVVSVLFAGLIEGASSIQMAFQIPETVASLMQGIILFCVIACDFFTRYSIRIARTETERMEAKA